MESQFTYNEALKASLIVHNILFLLLKTFPYMGEIPAKANVTYGGALPIILYDKIVAL
jgi:hypothetical protein